MLGIPKARFNPQHKKQANSTPHPPITKAGKNIQGAQLVPYSLCRPKVGAYGEVWASRERSSDNPS